MKTPPLVTRFTRRARFRAHINTRLLRLHNGTESVTSEVSQDEALTGLSLDGEECTVRAAITTRYSTLLTYMSSHLLHCKLFSLSYPADLWLFLRCLVLDHCVMVVHRVIGEVVIEISVSLVGYYLYSTKETTISTYLYVWNFQRREFKTNLRRTTSLGCV